MSLFFCPSFSVRLLLRQVLAQVEIFWRRKFFSTFNQPAEYL